MKSLKVTIRPKVEKLPVKIAWRYLQSHLCQICWHNR